jgi:hypothetical protein
MIPSPQMINQAMAMRGSMGAGFGGMGGVDAEEFSKKLITLKVGAATEQDCIALLGQPAMNNEGSLMYILKNTGQAMPCTAVLFFKNGVLSSVKVNKSSMSGGTFNNNSVYSSGNIRY